MIEIDGSIGEGGGQILRTSLTLSLITLQPIRIQNIRAGRKQPGLRPQHLQTVLAAAEICGGKVSGAEIGSTSMIFSPGTVAAGNYSFDIGTAGSVTLLLQTIILPLAVTNKKSKISVRGGTHVPWSPCYHYFAWHWIPYIAQMGFTQEFFLEMAGYYPRGGGRVSGIITPYEHLTPLDLQNRGKIKEIRGLSSISNLPRKIAERQRNQVIKRLGSKFPLNDIRIKNIPSNGKGTMMLLIVECDYSRACFFGLGALGKPSEKVADEAIDALLDFIAADCSIDPFLADQLLLPMVLSRGSSIMSTSKVTNHLLTNAEIIKRFMPVDIQIDGGLGSPGMVVVKPKDQNR
jgi:RNA 3'-terminal phosphate cyclase (ATP)